MGGSHNTLLNAKETFETLSSVEPICEMGMLLSSSTIMSSVPLYLECIDKFESHMWCGVRDLSPWYNCHCEEKLH